MAARNRLQRLQFSIGQGNRRLEAVKDAPDTGAAHHLPGADLPDGIDDLGRGAVLQQNAMNACLDSAGQNLGLQASRQQHEPRRRGPAARFEEHLKTVCAGHIVVWHRTIRREFPYRRDGIDSC